MCADNSHHPAAPSEEAIDHELVAYGRFAVALWRCSEHPGGMDWVEAVAKMLREHDTILRSQLARKDEGLKNAVEMAASEFKFLRMAIDANDPKDELLFRCDEARGRLQTALREPDGRKGEP